ncbi:MAG TPA: hypothetical protein VK483_04895 [Chitinophagaceae bacterium]|nr:hypothetical protein [Chitinophagaceae bacterium]
MKSIVMPTPIDIGAVQLSEEIKKQLLHEVKETLATGIGVKNKKRFTPADMWNLQRNMRTASDMLRR